MYPKSPAKRRWGIRRANILPPRGVFAVRSPQIMHGAQILPPSDGFDPCAGMPARATASRDRPSTAWPLPRGGCLPPQRLANTRHLPIPVTCQYPPLAAPIAVRDKPPMSFGGDHPAHGLQSGQAPRGCRLRHLDGQADNGMLRRARPGSQDRGQVGAEPPARACRRARPQGRGPRASRGEEAHTRARDGERLLEKAAAFFAKSQA